MYIDCGLVIFGCVLVGGKEYIVGLVGVDVEVVDIEGFNVMFVCYDDSYFVILY